MADANDQGFLRGNRTSGMYGPLVVSGAAGAALVPAAGASSAGALTTDTQARVASSATAVTLLAANATRKSASIFNESTAILYVKHGSAATVIDYKLQVPPLGYYELPFPLYQGAITGIWASANGAAQVCEGA